MGFVRFFYCYFPFFFVLLLCSYLPFPFMLILFYVHIPFIFSSFYLPVDSLACSFFVSLLFVLVCFHVHYMFFSFFSFPLYLSFHVMSHKSISTYPYRNTSFELFGFALGFVSSFEDTDLILERCLLLSLLLLSCSCFVLQSSFI